MSIFLSKILTIDHNYYYKKFVLLSHTGLTKDIFLKNAKVTKNSFAESLALTLYTLTIERSIHLNFDYTHYYFEEFDNFTQYLGKKFLFDHDVIENIISQPFDCNSFYIDPEVLPNSNLIMAFFDGESIHNTEDLYRYED